MQAEVWLVLVTLLAAALLVSLLPQRVDGAHASPSGAAPAGAEAPAARVVIRFASGLPGADRRASVRAAGGLVVGAAGTAGLVALLPAAAIEPLRTAMGVRSVRLAGAQPVGIVGSPPA